MAFLLAAIVIALAGGYLLGGRLRNVEALRLRGWWLAPIGLLLQVQFPWLSDNPDSGVPYLIASYAALILFAALNLRLAGFALILGGLALNLLVVSVNGGMPVSRSALIRSGQRDVLSDLRSGHGAKHHLASDDDVLLPLADVIAIPSPLSQVISFGDILVYSGVVWLVVAAMRGRPWLATRGRPRDSDRRAAAPATGKAPPPEGSRPSPRYPAADPSPPGSTSSGTEP